MVETLVICVLIVQCSSEVNINGIFFYVYYNNYYNSSESMILIPKDRKIDKSICVTKNRR